MDKFDRLEKEIRDAGQYAKQQQRLIHRYLKDDGSVLTETDLAVTDHIIKALRDIFVSDFNIVTEEIDLKEFNPDSKYTFVLDPIDGTDRKSVV